MVQVWRNPDGRRLRFQFEEEAPVFEVSADTEGESEIESGYVPGDWIELHDSV